MPDLLLTLLMGVAILLVADLLLSVGAMAMVGVSAMAGPVAHPFAAAAFVVLAVVIALVIGEFG
jgi:hypothetical protein